MPGALTRIRIIWSLSPMEPQVPGVTPESPLCQWCCGHSSWNGARQLWIEALCVCLNHQTRVWNEASDPRTLGGGHLFVFARLD
jgi:hypothetical protein